MLRKAFGTHPATCCDPPETGGFAGGQPQGFVFLISHPNNKPNFIPTTGLPSRCTRCRGPASRGGRVATCCGVGVHEKRELQERGMKKRGIKKRVNKFHRCGAKRPVGASAGTRLDYIRTLYLFRRRSKLRTYAPQRWSLLPRLTSFRVWIARNAIKRYQIRAGTYDFGFQTRHWLVLGNGIFSRLPCSGDVRLSADSLFHLYGLLRRWA